MDFFKRYALATIIVVALIGSFFVSRADNRKQIAAVKRAAVEECIVTGARSALVISYKIRTAQAAADRGEAGLELEYRAFARGGALLIPVAKGQDDGRDHVAEVTKVPSKRGYVFGLSERSKKLIREGCIASYN